MKNKAAIMNALTLGMLAMGERPMGGFDRMSQTDFENAVRAKVRAQIETEKRRAQERAENPREKKKTKKTPKFNNNYVGMPKKVKQP